MSSVTGVTGNSQTNSPPAGSTGASGTDKLASESTFLQLLVAQIKNQDPTNPTDATQFVGQLTQYSELEQLININTNVQKIAPATTPATTSGTAASGSTTGATTNKSAN